MMIEGIDISLRRSILYVICIMSVENYMMI